MRLLLLALLAANTAAAQTLQYRSPAGVEYYSLPDTGAVARAESVLATGVTVERLVTLGLAQIAIRQYRESIGSFTRAMAIEPGNALLYRHRGHRYISVRRLDSAIADLERGYRLDSTMYGILYHLGVARYLRGEFSAAATAFDRARRYPPDNSERTGANDWLWMARSRAGHTAEANAGLAELPVTVTTGGYTQRVRLYRGEITPDQVVTAADTAGITLATLWYGVGNWHLIRGEVATAHEFFQRVVQTNGWPAFGFMAAEVELRRLR